MAFVLKFLLAFFLFSSTIFCQETLLSGNLQVEIFMSLLEYSRNHTDGRSTFKLTFSVVPLPLLKLRKNLPNFQKIFLLYYQIDEMCPKDFGKCFCFFGEPKKTGLGLNYIQMCSSDPGWIEYKRQLMERKSKGLILQKPEADLIIRGDINRKPVKMGLMPWETYELNKHYKSLCPHGLEWCSCLVVSNYTEYFETGRSYSKAEKPTAVVDCRPSRYYETRNCRPEPKEKLPWYKQIFSLTILHFPCGHFYGLLDLIFEN